MTSNTSDTDRATNRIADLTLVAATNHPSGCPIAAVAHDLLVGHVGPDAAEHLIGEARAVLYRDPANPAEKRMTATDEALFRVEQGS